MNPAYSELVWEHFRKPRRAGSLAADALIGEADTPAARARVRLSLRCEGELIRDAAFQALGCPCTIAAGSWLAAHCVGRKREELLRLSARELEEQLQLPAVKRYSAVMAVEALHRALNADKDFAR